MRNCAPRLIESGTNPEGIPYRMYLDEMTGMVFVAMDFEQLRRLQEAKERAKLRSWQEPVRRLGYHKLVKK
jgi:hypothetical protein